MSTPLQHALDALNFAFTEKHHSLASYILEARPYIRPGQQPLMEAVAEVATEDRREAEHLLTVIEELNGIGQVQPYHAHVAELNYLALDYLARVLTRQIERQQQRYALTARDPQMPSRVCDAFLRMERLATAQLARLHRAATASSGKIDPAG